MSGLQAARMGDSIGGHTSAFWGFIVGLAVGLVVGLAFAALILTAPISGPLLAIGALCVAVGGVVSLGAVGAKLGKHWGSTMKGDGTPCSIIPIGSPDTRIEDQKVARAEQDLSGPCLIRKMPPVPISQGSSLVFVNNKMLVRDTDKAKCGGKVIMHCLNVWVGGPAGGEDSSELPDWVPSDHTLDMLALGGGLIALAGSVIVFGAVATAVMAGIGFAGGKLSKLGGEWLGARRDRAEGRTDHQWENLYGESAEVGGGLLAGLAGGKVAGMANARIAEVPALNKGGITRGFDPPPLKAMTSSLDPVAQNRMLGELAKSPATSKQLIRLQERGYTMSPDGSLQAPHVNPSTREVSVPPGARAEDLVVPPRAEEVVPPPRAEEVVPPPRAEEVVPPPRAEEVVPPPRDQAALDPALPPKPTPDVPEAAWPEPFPEPAPGTTRISQMERVPNEQVSGALQGEVKASTVAAKVSLIKSILAGEPGAPKKLPAVSFVPDPENPGSLLVFDGTHTYAAYRELGFEVIPGKVYNQEGVAFIQRQSGFNPEHRIPIDELTTVPEFTGTPAQQAAARAAGKSGGAAPTAEEGGCTTCGDAATVPKASAVEPVNAEPISADRVAAGQKWLAEKVAAGAPKATEDLVALKALDARNAANYQRIKAGELSHTETTAERLKLAVEGDVDGQRVPLTFKDRAQFDRFQADVRNAFESEGIYDAEVVQIGSATTGYKGNPDKYAKYVEAGGTPEGWADGTVVTDAKGKPLKGTWDDSSDTDLAIFSKQSMAQASEANAPYNDHYGFIKSGKPGEPGFDDTPIGQKLQSVSQKWNQEIYGTPNPDNGGFEFKLNTGDNGFDGAPTIYQGGGR